jgi:tetratricopeptide (TPR) repeat protein
MKKKTIGLIWRVVWGLLLIMLGASLQVWISSGRFWWQARPGAAVVSNAANPAQAATASRVDSLADKIANLDKRADDLDKRADEVERMLTLLLGLSTIYALALGFGAYAQLKDSANDIEKLRERTEEKINHVPDDIENIRKDAREEIEGLFLKTQAKIPMLADMNDRIRDIMQRLIRLLPIMDPSLDWRRDKYYAALSPEAKENILFWEKTAAVFTCFDLQGQDRQTVSEIYHGFGNFYGLRFGLREMDSRKQHQEELDRSRFYLDLAVHYNPENSGALNDRGYVALELDGDNVKAKECFEDSLKFDPEQQRARYDLALIDHQGKDYASAAALLSAAMEKKHWQGNLGARYRPSLLYNRACAYTQLGNTKTDVEQRKKDFDKALDDLQTLDSLWLDEEPTILDFFVADIRPGGDFGPLLLEQPWKHKVESLALYSAATSRNSQA